MRLLTKSRFKQALECPNKLYYTKKKEYGNLKQEDPFLEALAQGGFQVEELARLEYPEKYAIWDSRIFRFITEKKSQYGIDKPENYLEYLKGLAEVSNNKNYQSFHKKVESKFDYKITAFRAIEIVMFETDRYNQKK